jgi:hypothetical protein
MNQTADTPTHFSLTGVEPPGEPIELLPGITLTPVRPHVTLQTFFKKLSEDTMVFGVSFGPHISSLAAEISVSEAASGEWDCAPSNLAWLVTMLFRLRHFEYLSCPICSSYPMSKLSQAPDKSVRVFSVEFARGRWLQPQADDAKVDLGDVIEQQ